MGRSRFDGKGRAVGKTIVVTVETGKFRIAFCMLLQGFLDLPRLNRSPFEVSGQATVYAL